MGFRPNITNRSQRFYFGPVGKAEATKFGAREGMVSAKKVGTGLLHLCFSSFELPFFLPQVLVPCAFADMRISDLGPLEGLGDESI